MTPGDQKSGIRDREGALGYSPSSMIDMQGVKKVYNSGLIALEALNELSLRVERGEFVAIMGPSGSGKTTFLNIAGLLDSFDEGRYLLDGQDVRACCDNDLAQIRNRKIGFVFQSFNLIPDLDVHDNLEIPLRYRGMRAGERKARIDRVLEEVGLTARRHHLPTELSGGQQQRVAIARALVGDPQLILADEPTGNLDSVMAGQIMELLARINGQGTTIVMVTHSPELAARADRKLHILDGKAIDPWAGKKRGVVVRTRSLEPGR
ncbi:MAG TPA: ABC transporter ATP-binding protein [Polyangiales bacterium]|nr:ABC transporter ATP-binding protein [Polyangiales bacterium]